MNMEEIRIVLVDDHQMLRAGVRRILAEQSGLLVVGEASDGAAALDEVRATKPNVVVVDIHMPGEDGIALSERLLKEFPGIKVIVLSADADLATITRALHAGVSGYVLKDNPPEDFLQAIREAVDQRVYLSPQVASLVVQDYMKVVVNPTEAPRPVLTARERLLVKLVAEGKRNKEIAEQLQVGVKSVETYRARLMQKLGCASTADLTRYAVREKVVEA
jgi:two-component system, NarL family, response regulator NreC